MFFSNLAMRWPAVQLFASEKRGEVSHPLTHFNKMGYNMSSKGEVLNKRRAPRLSGSSEMASTPTNRTSNGRKTTPSSQHPWQSSHPSYYDLGADVVRESSEKLSAAECSCLSRSRIPRVGTSMAPTQGGQFPPRSPRPENKIKVPPI